MTQRNRTLEVSAAVAFLTMLACLIVPSCGTSTASDRPTQDFLNRRTEIDWTQIQFGVRPHSGSFGLISFAPVQESGGQFALVGNYMAGIPVTLVNSLGFPFYQGETIASEQPLQGFLFPATLIDTQGEMHLSTALFAILGPYDDYEVLSLWSVNSNTDIHSGLNWASFGFEFVGYYGRNPDVFAFFYDNTMGYLLSYPEAQNPVSSSCYEERWISKYYVIIYNNCGYRLETSKGHGSPLLFSIDSRLFAYIYFNGCERGFNGPNILEICEDGVGWSYHMSPHMNP